jgi:hypothetical protein
MIKTRAAVVTAVTLVPLAVFGGVGFAKGNASASEYQYGPSGGQYGKVTICHRTHSKKHPYVKITVSVAAWLHGHGKHAGDIKLNSSSDTCPTTPPAAPTNNSSTTHGNSGDHGNGNNGHHGKP